MAYTLPLVTDATLIATDKYPLRASALPKINECPASVFLSEEFWHIDEDDTETGGEAAQTGNLVHSAAHAFHTEALGLPPDNRTEAGLAALEAAREKFPAGDPKRARKIFQAYAADKANQEAEVVASEQKIICRLPPAPFDPTGQPVVIRGTLDQVRIVNGVPTVHDIKTGKKFYGLVALDHYMTQQAAYTLGARQTWGDKWGAPVEPGTLICTDGYFRPNGRVFWYHSWGVERIPLILQNVVTQVAAARMKFLGFASSTDACQWCEHKKFANCSAFYSEHLK